MEHDTNRFEKIYSHGLVTVNEIWVDKETGVNYLWHKDANAGGLTPLLDKTGRPFITPLPLKK